MHGHGAVVDLAFVAVPLPRAADRGRAALARPRLVDATDRLRVSMLLRHDPLTPITHVLFSPLHRFEKTLQRPRRNTLPQCDRLGVLAGFVRQLPPHVHLQQLPGVAPSKTPGKRLQKQSQLPPQGPNPL